MGVEKPNYRLGKRIITKWHLLNTPLGMKAEKAM